MLRYVLGDLAFFESLETSKLLQEVEIVSGLEAGDEIVISETTRFEGARRVLVR